MDVTNWTDAQIETLINDVYSGVVSPSRLPVNIYTEIKDRLTTGVLNGFGGDVIDFADGSPERDLLEHFKYNVAIFSGAKTHQQVADMTREVFKDGIKQPFKEFKDKATTIFDEYNKNWLLTEFNMSHQQAIFGRKWTDIQRNADIFPKLKYVTSGDGRVRPEHAILDGIVRRVDDPFWRQYYPPNDWGCRCNVEQMTGEEISTPDHVVAEKRAEYVPSALFNGNSGIDKVIFDPSSHPYFLVADRYKLLLSENFNLPTPPKPRTRVVKTSPAKPTPPLIDPKISAIHKSMKELTGLDPTIVNERIWKHVPDNLLFQDSFDYPRTKYKNKSFYESWTKKVHLGVKNDPRWKGFQKEKVVIHEIGHAVHYQLKQIDDFQVSERSAKLLKDLRTAFKKRFPVQHYGAEQLDPTKSTPFWTYTDTNKDTTSFVKKATDFLVGKGISENDASEMLSTVYDIVGGLTKGDLGGGHDVSYYKKNNGGIKEVFANLFQICNATDPRARMTLAEFFPEALEIGDEYFNDILK